MRGWMDLPSLEWLIPLQVMYMGPSTAHPDLPIHTHTHTQDPALASSLPTLLFLADVFWTGLVVERPLPPPARGGDQEEAGE